MTVESDTGAAPGHREATPRRPDSQRRFDALITSARDVFASDGVKASLEEIARRAGVGIGTLYRNFPTRESLFEAVYIDEVEALARVAEELTDQRAGEALGIWLRQFVSYATTKRAIVEALNLDSPQFAPYISAIHRAGEPLLAKAQETGDARDDVSFDDVRRLITSIAAASFADGDQRERVLGIALDGLKPQP